MLNKIIWINLRGSWPTIGCQPGTIKQYCPKRFREFLWILCQFWIINGIEGHVEHILKLSCSFLEQAIRIGHKLCQLFSAINWEEVRDIYFIPIDFFGNEAHSTFDFLTKREQAVYFALNMLHPFSQNSDTIVLAAGIPTERLERTWNVRNNVL